MRDILAVFLCVILLSGCAVKVDEKPAETGAPMETVITGYPITLYAPNEDVTGFLQISAEILETGHSIYDYDLAFYPEI